MRWGSILDTDFLGQQFLVEGKVPVVQSLDGPPITEELAALIRLAI
jgi:hypothetical protein